MSKRSFRTALVIVLATMTVLGGAVLFVGYKIKKYPDKPNPGSGDEIAVEIRPGMAFPKIATLLESKGLVDSARYFRLYAMDRGATRDVKPGKYLLKSNLTPRQVLDALRKGVKQESVLVTIPEGKHMLEVFDRIANARIADRAELERLARDAKFIESVGITGPTVDGYLFPETYRFVVPTSAKKVLERLIRTHRDVWTKLQRKHKKRFGELASKLKWSNRDFLIMASIVEKEAVNPDERPRIAQVFMNRLTSPRFKSRRLETDPTIRYGCMVPQHKSAACKKWDKAGRLFTAQLRDDDNPYNTYRHAGLPPGPICNPGRASIEATFTPDGSNYFYFVAKNERTHVFSRTYEEHKRWVDKYQR